MQLNACCEYREAVNDRTLPLRWLRSMIHFGTEPGLDVCERCKPFARHSFARMSERCFDLLLGDPDAS